MEECVFCVPEKIEIERKLRLRNDFWYTVLPREVGTWGQMLLVVRRLRGERNHVTDIADPRIVCHEERLSSIFLGIHEISRKLKENLKDRSDRRVKKVYVLTQCETEHLHFQFFPRYEGDPAGNELLYLCELNETKWEKDGAEDASRRIGKMQNILRHCESEIVGKKWLHSKETKKETMQEIVSALNWVLTQP